MIFGNTGTLHRGGEGWLVQAVPERHSGGDAQNLHDGARRYQALLQIAQATVTRGLPDLIREVGGWIVSLFGVHLLAQSVHVPSRNHMLLHRLHWQSGSLLTPLELPIESAPSGWVWKNQKPLILSDLNCEHRFPRVIEFFRYRGWLSLLVLPMTTPRSALGALVFGSREIQEYDASTIDFLSRITGLMALATESALASERSEARHHAPNSVLTSHNLQTHHGAEEIIGESPVLKQLLQRVQTVAPSGTTVLITGETGTGKELIARAIHRLSARSNGRFVHLNCAAIPTGLLESELFGHEKGAFTSANSQKIGRLEHADGGTLFLDEIGEIPLELQPKLLRALQGQEFERLGGNKTIRVNARVIAATNRDLQDAITQRQFRSDLFYRLNVFPIHVPPLRERLSDIQPLVGFFVSKFAKEMRRTLEAVSDESIAQLQNWHWPGNIRELENFIERSVLLSNGSVLRLPIAELREKENQKLSREDTLEEVEREYIVRTLRAVRGVISGSHGAAAKLGMKRTTLQSKIQRLGISRAEYEF